MILMNDFRQEPSALREAMMVAVGRVLESGWYILGEELQAFEKEWAAVCGMPHAVGVGNGMDAIEISLRALGIGPGDEVITTAMTAFASVLAIIRAGAQPVLADIDPDTGLMSLDSAKRCLSPRTRAILLVHLYGQVRDMDAWQSFCREREIFLIEDCAQAHLATWRGKVAGSFSALGAYSFYPTKNLGAAGDAGMVVTDDDESFAKACQLRNYGQSVRYQHPELGLNSRLDEMQAAMLSVRLKWLPNFTERRQSIARAYRERICNEGVRLLAPPQEGRAHVYHLFVVNCDRRDDLSRHLEAHGIQSLIHYPVPIHEQQPCTGLARDPVGLANSERHGATCLSLPCHPQMSDEEVEIVIRAVNSFPIS